MAEKKKPTTKKESAPKKITAKVRKEVIAQEQDKLEVAAKKIALKTMTEMQLATQVELTDLQKQAAKLLAQGFTHEETASKIGLTQQEVVAWMALPSFVREVNEKTIKEGASDKNERVRSAKRIHDEILNAILKKAADDKFEDLPLSVLHDMFLKISGRIDTLVDKKEEQTKKDLTVLILGHVQQQNGKQYNQLDDFLNDPEFKFDTIDVDAEEVNDS
jgi:hypothetical protein